MTDETAPTTLPGIRRQAIEDALAQAFSFSDPRALRAVADRLETVIYETETAELRTMNKVIEVTPRQQQLIISGLRERKVQESQLLRSEDEGMRRLAKQFIREIDDLIAEVVSAPLA